MSELLRQQKESFTLANGEARDFSGQFDFIHFETLPTGVTVELNGTPPLSQKAGAVRQGVPGQNQIERFRFVNGSGGSAAIVVLFGTGTFSISGEMTLSGILPLAAGASTAANQSTEIANLGSIITKQGDQLIQAAAFATAAKQDTLLAAVNSSAPTFAAMATSAKQDTLIADSGTQIASLSSIDTKLPAAGTRTGRVRNMAINTGITFSGCKRLAVLNTATSGNVSILIAGNTGTLGAGQGCDFAVDNPADTLADIYISTSASSTALVVTTI